MLAFLQKTSRGFRGFSLVEMLIAVAVISMASVVLVSLITGALTGWSSGTSKDTASSNATLAMQRLANEIRDGRIAYAYSNTLVVYFPMSITDEATGMVTYDKSASDPVPRIYYVADGNLVRSVQGVTSVVARGISSATFGASGGMVSITLVSSEQVGHSQSQCQVTGRVTLRNFRS